MSTIRGVKDRRFKFTQVLNTTLEDRDLSLRAKGFISYCLSKESSWKFYVTQLASVLKEGEKAIYSIIDECIEQGYAYRYQLREEKGRFLSWEMVISDSKEEIATIKQEVEELLSTRSFQPDAASGDPATSDPVKYPTSNKNKSNTKKTNTKEQQTRAAPPAVVFCALDETRCNDLSIKHKAALCKEVAELGKSEQDLMQALDYAYAIPEGKLRKSRVAAIIDSLRKGYSSPQNDDPLTRLAYEVNDAFPAGYESIQAINRKTIPLGRMTVISLYRNKPSLEQISLKAALPKELREYKAVHEKL